MGDKSAAMLDAVPLRNAKAELRKGEGAVQKLKASGGEVLDRARFNARMEPKAMADAVDLSHSLVLRALGNKGGDMGFIRMWESLPDEFWFELAVLILESRGARLRRVFEVEKVG